MLVLDLAGELLGDEVVIRRRQACIGEQPLAVLESSLLWHQKNNGYRHKCATWTLPLPRFEIDLHWLEKSEPSLLQQLPKR